MPYAFSVVPTYYILQKCGQHLISMSGVWYQGVLHNITQRSEPVSRNWLSCNSWRTDIKYVHCTYLCPEAWFDLNNGHNACWFCHFDPGSVIYMKFVLEIWGENSDTEVLRFCKKQIPVKCFWILKNVKLFLRIQCTAREPFIDINKSIFKQFSGLVPNYTETSW